MNSKEKKKVKLEFNIDISVKIPFTEEEIEAFKKLKKVGEHKGLVNDFANNLRTQVLEGIEAEFEPKVQIKQAKAKLVK